MGKYNPDLTFGYARVVTPHPALVPEDQIDSPVTCAWCRREALGFAVWPVDRAWLYLSCGRENHGVFFKLSTAKHCVVCHDPIEQKRNDAKYCSRSCGDTARMRRHRLRKKLALAV